MNKIKNLLPFALIALIGFGGFLGMTKPWEYDGPARFEVRSVTISPSLYPQARKWQGNGIIFVQQVKNPQITVEWLNYDLPGMAAAEATRTFTNGNYIASCNIRIGASNYDTAVMSHEFGHCLGLSHENHKAGTNMYRAAHFYNEGWSDTVTNWDRKNLASLYAK